MIEEENIESLEKPKVEQPKIEEPTIKPRVEPEKVYVVRDPDEKTNKKSQGWWTKFINKKKFKNPNKVAIIFLRNNGNADLLQKKAKNGFFTIHEKQYHENNDCTYNVTKDRIPLAIIREWDIIPLGTKKWEDQTMREQFAQLEDHVLKGIRNAELVKSGGGGLDSKITTKQMILWGLALLVGAILLVNYI